MSLAGRAGNQLENLRKEETQVMRGEGMGSFTQLEPFTIKMRGSAALPVSDKVTLLRDFSPPHAVYREITAR